MNLKNRLAKISKTLSKRGEVSTDKILVLYMDFVRCMVVKGVPIPDYILPPFEKVTLEDYKRAKKELEEFESRIE